MDTKQSFILGQNWILDSFLRAVIVLCSVKSKYTSKIK
jgi:hypothetical protein